MSVRIVISVERVLRIRIFGYPNQRTTILILMIILEVLI